MNSCTLLRYSNCIRHRRCKALSSCASLYCIRHRRCEALYPCAAGQAQAQGGAQPTKANVPEVVGPDGPITPEVEELGTPHSEASPDQVCTAARHVL